MNKICTRCKKRFEVDQVLCAMLKMDTEKIVRCDACYMRYAVA